MTARTQFWVGVSIRPRYLPRLIPKLMWSRVRVTLQLTVSPSVLALSPSGTHDQILVVLKTVAVLFVVGSSPCRGDGSIT